MKKILTLILILFSTQSFAVDFPLPTGWQPAESDGDYSLETSGDFDGNGEEDLARILSPQGKGNMNALYVTFTRAGMPQHVKLTELEKEDSIGIKTLPGQMISAPKIACTGNDNDDRDKKLCDEDCNCRNILTEGDVIMGNSGDIRWFWYWDKGSFKLIWAK